MKKAAAGGMHIPLVLWEDRHYRDTAEPGAADEKGMLELEPQEHVVEGKIGGEPAEHPEEED
jgi:hypothetical protein